MRDPLVRIALVSLSLGLCGTAFVASAKDEVFSCPAGHVAQGIDIKAQNFTCVALPSSSGDLAALQAMVNAQSALIAQLQEKLGCMTKTGDDVYFTGCNVHVRNGLGATGPNVNGLGNLIVGYNEDAAAIVSNPPNEPSVKTGSHNVVIGAGNTYTDRGGLVAGTFNKITARYATVTGGARNTASAQYSSVSGGIRNTASGDFSSVGGGTLNIASGINASISGGEQNIAGALNSSVTGGVFNQAGGSWSSVSGGIRNAASGDYSSVSGGGYGKASGPWSSVSGGSDGEASGNTSSVSGGIRSKAKALFSSVSGGQDNFVHQDDQGATVSGGAFRSSNGINSWTGGGLFAPN